MIKNRECPHCNSKDLAIKDKSATIFLNKKYNYSFELTSEELLREDYSSSSIADKIETQVHKIYDDYMLGMISVQDLEALYEPEITRPEEINDIPMICNSCNNVFISQISFSFFGKLYFTFLEHEDEELMQILNGDFSIELREIIDYLNTYKSNLHISDDILKPLIIDSLWNYDSRKFLKIKKLGEAMKVLPPNYGGDESGINLILLFVYSSIASGVFYDILKYGISRIRTEITNRDKKAINAAIKKQQECDDKNLYFEYNSKEDLISIFKTDPQNLTYEEQIAAIEDFCINKALQIREGLVALIVDKNKKR